MPALIWSRDLGDDVANAQNTFSSWDSCMTEAYCKWPAIIGIIVGSLIIISIIWCCARCLCCGAECCCGCLSCCNRCCPSPRNKNDGYQQPPAQPYGYHSHPPPMYGGGYGGYGGYRGPQTATFDAPSTKYGQYNEDALPAMPSWDQASSRRVEDHNDVEMEKLDQHTAQQESLLPRNDAGAVAGGRYYNNQPQPTRDNGDLGTMQSSPYHDYDSHQQYVGSPVSSSHYTTQYPPTYHIRPQSSVYDQSEYAPSIPPSYHTAAPSFASPVYQQTPGRRPVQGTWRDV